MEGAKIFGVVALLLLAACSQSDDPETQNALQTRSTGPSADMIGDTKISFSKQVQPIFQRSCGTCHGPAAPLQNLVLTGPDAYSHIAGKPSTESELLLVRSGDPSKSYLFRKITGQHLPDGTGARMPVGSALAPGDIELIRQWIEQGALKN